MFEFTVLTLGTALLVGMLHGAFSEKFMDRFSILWITMIVIFESMVIIVMEPGLSPGTSLTMTMTIFAFAVGHGMGRKQVIY